MRAELALSGFTGSASKIYQRLHQYCALQKSALAGRRGGNNHKQGNVAIKDY
jgi:hypothetical protein